MRNTGYVNDRLFVPPPGSKHFYLAATKCHKKWKQSIHFAGNRQIYFEKQKNPVRKSISLSSLYVVVSKSSLKNIFEALNVLSSNRVPKCQKDMCDKHTYLVVSFENKFFKFNFHYFVKVFILTLFRKKKWFVLQKIVPVPLFPALYFSFVVFFSLFYPYSRFHQC